jgi:hypothetical protein
VNALGWWSGATRRPVSYYTASGDFSGVNPIGWILHVVVGNGSPFPYFNGLKKPDRKFSNFWFAKNGKVEQYAPGFAKPWAQGDGNAFYLACETEGNPDEPLTVAQIDSLARFHIWTGLPDKLADAVGQRGIGTHSMGGAAWGGHACPGTIRAGQRRAILARVAELRHPAPKPAPAPVPSPLKEKTMLIIRVTGYRDVYLVGGPLGVVHVRNSTELAVFAVVVPSVTLTLEQFTTYFGALPNVPTKA